MLIYIKKLKISEITGIFLLILKCSFELKYKIIGKEQKQIRLDNSFKKFINSIKGFS